MLTNVSPRRLGVNIDHVATLRQARKTHYPEIAQAATLAELGGADLITVHLREDRRHIQDRDARILKEVLNVPLNLEMAATKEMVQFAVDLKPAMTTIVPEIRAELTTEGGLNLKSVGETLLRTLDPLFQAGIPISLFIDPNYESVEYAHKNRFPIVELHSGNYANAESPTDITAALKRLEEAANYGDGLGLQVNVGHGLTLWNVAPIAAISKLRDFHIGHAIISHAVFVGLERAVSEMKAKISII